MIEWIRGLMDDIWEFRNLRRERKLNNRLDGYFRRATGAMPMCSPSRNWIVFDEATNLTQEDFDRAWKSLGQSHTPTIRMLMKTAYRHEILSRQLEWSLRLPVSVDVTEYAEAIPVEENSVFAKEVKHDITS